MYEVRLSGLQMEYFTQGVILKRAPRGFKVGEVLRSRWSIWEVLRSREATDDQYSLIDRQTFSCVPRRAALLSGIVSIVLRNLRGQVPALTVQSANSKAGMVKVTCQRSAIRWNSSRRPFGPHTHTHLGTLWTQFILWQSEFVISKLSGINPAM